MRKQTGSERRWVLSFLLGCWAAQVVDEDCDANAIEALMGLEIQYGQHRVDAALKLIAQKNSDNPLRSIAYLIATVKNMK